MALGGRPRGSSRDCRSLASAAPQLQRRNDAGEHRYQMSPAPTKALYRWVALRGPGVAVEGKCGPRLRLLAQEQRTRRLREMKPHLPQALADGGVDDAALRAKAKGGPHGDKAECCLCKKGVPWASHALLDCPAMKAEQETIGKVAEKWAAKGHPQLLSWLLGGSRSRRHLVAVLT
eukprot:gene7817-4343_t